MSKQDKWVRRFEVDETAKHNRGFTIYKITSVLFPISSPEVLSIVSVWKRYSEVQRLYTSVSKLHSGLQLKGICPELPTCSYFKRFQPEIISERGTAIKALLEFVAEHRLLFTSTDFVNFLQTGYPEPEITTPLTNSIASIRSSLHLPLEDTPPLEYGTDDDDANPPSHSIDETDYSQIPIYQAADVEPPMKPIHRQDRSLSKTNSFESLNSLESIDSDLYSELEKVSVTPRKSAVKKVLPDLIDFEEPSTSASFDDYHTMTEQPPSLFSAMTQGFDTQNQNSTQNIQEFGQNVSTSATFEDYHTMSRSFNTENRNPTQNIHEFSPNVLNESLSDISISSNTNTCTTEMDSSIRSSSRTSHSMLSLSNLECKTKTEDSYIFEAGYLLNLARRCEDTQQYDKAFHWYKAAIEKMLIGVQEDCDPQRRALVKVKTDKYLSYAEQVYRKHMTGDVTLQPQTIQPPQMQTPPISMLRRPYDDLSLYRVLAVIADSMMLVLHQGDQTCYAMKVIQKIPNNLTEFDEYFMKNSNETRNPILPTLVPYMVSLISYIETTNLIFLILTYAPGEKLLDYIKNYVKSVPNTPARELNLENVFSEPKVMKLEEEKQVFETKDVYFETDKENLNKFQLDNEENGNLNLNKENSKLNIEKIVMDLDNSENTKNINISTEKNGTDLNIINKNDKYSKETEKSIELYDTEDIVRNSKTLLQNVDRILKSNEITKIISKDETDRSDNIGSKREDITKYVTRKDKRVGSASSQLSFRTGCIPPSTIQKWGAEMLIAIDSLHRCGVICRDLNPSNILLGDRGQVCLTYTIGYSDYNVHLPKLRLHRTNMYIAPELYDVNYCMRLNNDCEFELERVCDYWSFGAIMYEIICGVPLCHHHVSPFASHTVLTLPDCLTVDESSLLTQLLTYDPCARLGSGTHGIEEIKSHPYFRHIHWPSVSEAWNAAD